jgi:hypothetical protein
MIKFRGGQDSHIYVSSPLSWTWRLFLPRLVLVHFMLNSEFAYSTEVDKKETSCVNRCLIIFSYCYSVIACQQFWDKKMVCNVVQDCMIYQNPAIEKQSTVAGYYSVYT